KLERLCARYAELLPDLLAAPATVVHGEYGPKNILIRGAEVYPVDWESAAVGPGEVDLAALVHRWGERSTRVAARAYVATRWPDGAPPGHERAFDAAKLYWLL